MSINYQFHTTIRPYNSKKKVAGKKFLYTYGQIQVNSVVLARDIGRKCIVTIKMV